MVPTTPSGRSTLPKIECEAMWGQDDFRSIGYARIRELRADSYHVTYLATPVGDASEVLIRVFATAKPNELREQRRRARLVWKVKTQTIDVVAIGCDRVGRPYVVRRCPPLPLCDFGRDQDPRWLLLAFDLRRFLQRLQTTTRRARGCSRSTNLH